jgi:hypothetical protein
MLYFGNLLLRCTILGLSVITRRRAITEVFVFYDFFDFLGVRLRPPLMHAVPPSNGNEVGSQKAVRYRLTPGGNEPPSESQLRYR